MKSMMHGKCRLVWGMSRRWAKGYEGGNNRKTPQHHNSLNDEYTLGGAENLDQQPVPCNFNSSFTFSAGKVLGRYL